jgi:alanine dehydrogenase
VTALSIVSEAAVRRVTTRPLVLEAVRRALISVSDGDGRVFPVVQGTDPEKGWSFGVKSGYAREAGALGFKYGGYFPANKARGLPAHGSTTVLADPETGSPRAIVSAGYLNGLRTAAADAAAVAVLARPDAGILGLVGAGHQAEFEARAIAEVRPLRLVKVWNRDAGGAERLRASLRDLGVEVTITSLRDAVAGSDIVVTATAAREPLVMAGDVSPGTHISAMGADQPGKQELDPQLVAAASLFADLPAQSVSIGEFQHAVRAGLVEAAAIAPIGRVLADPSHGRRNDNEVTVFDSSGIALQDLFVADAVLRAAEAASLVQTVAF